MVFRKVIATVGLVGLLALAGCAEKRTEHVTRTTYKGVSQGNEVTVSQDYSYKSIGQIPGNMKSWPEYKVECRIYSSDSNSPWSEIIGITSTEGEVINGEWKTITFMPKKSVSDIPPADRIQAEDMLNRAVREVGTLDHKLSVKEETREF